MANITGNCSLLNGENSFSTYVALLKEVTAPDLSVSAMIPCRAAICSTLYGVGNSDISGIGVLIGYVMELTLGLVLATGLLVLKTESAWQEAVNSAFFVYADNALLLSGSIQLAAFITFVRKLFGRGANGFGDLTMQATWAAATLTMLPLLLLINMKSKLEERKRRLALIVLTWLLFAFVFISRMYEYFSNGQVGNSSTSIITSAQADNIASVCYQNRETLSRAQAVAFNFFTVGGSIFLSVDILLSLGWELLNEQARLRLRASGGQHLGNWIKGHGWVAQWLLIVSIAVWAIPQIWALFYFRSQQRWLAASLGVQDEDNSWSFGQIVAIIVFLPVFIDAGCTYWQWEPEKEACSLLKSNGSP